MHLCKGWMLFVHLQNGHEESGQNMKNTKSKKRRKKNKFERLLAYSGAFFMTLLIGIALVYNLYVLMNPKWDTFYGDTRIAESEKGANTDSEKEKGQITNMSESQWEEGADDQKGKDAEKGDNQESVLIDETRESSTAVEKEKRAGGDRRTDSETEWKLYNYGKENGDSEPEDNFKPSDPSDSIRKEDEEETTRPESEKPEEPGTEQESDSERESNDPVESEDGGEENPKPPASVVSLVCEGAIMAPLCIGADHLSIDGMTIWAVYSDGNKLQVDLNQCAILGVQTQNPGTYKGMIRYMGKTAEFSYQVAAYQVDIELNGGFAVSGNGLTYYLDNYTLDQVFIPEKYGFIFDGWYLDAAFTRRVEFPYKASFGECKIKFYAKWVEAESPYVITNGMITDFKGVVDDWMIRLPDKGCYGIAQDAFRNLKSSTSLRMIDIPPNYTKIEPGAFRGLKTLTSINIDFKNSVYASEDEAVYTKDKKTIVAYPEGITGEYAMLPSRMAEHVGKMAFEGFSLTKIVFPPSIKTIDAYGIGESVKQIRFTGTTLPEYISPLAFGNLAKAGNLVIEVPNECIEEYRAMFERIDKRLAKVVVGF